MIPVTVLLMYTPIKISFVSLELVETQEETGTYLSGIRPRFSVFVRSSSLLKDLLKERNNW